MCCNRFRCGVVVASRVIGGLGPRYTFSVFVIERSPEAPLLYVRAEGAPSDAELHESLASLARAVQAEQRRGHKVVMVVDMLRAHAINASQRRVAGAWMKQHYAVFSQVTLGSAFAISSPLVRGVLTALLWFQPFEMQNHIAADIDGAVRWAIERLEQEGVVVPARLRRELGRAFRTSEPPHP